MYTTTGGVIGVPGSEGGDLALRVAGLLLHLLKLLNIVALADN